MPNETVEQRDARFKKKKDNFLKNQKSEREDDDVKWDAIIENAKSRRKANDARKVKKRAIFEKLGVSQEDIEILMASL